MNARKLYIYSALVILTGCSQQLGTTLPGETNHQAIGTGYTSDDSLEMAVYTAEKYCSEQGKRHAISSTKNEYRGTVSEQTRDTLDTISSIAASTGNWIPTPGDDTDYKTTVNFMCL